MSVAIAVTPASGAINAKEDFVRIDVTDADPTITSRLKITKSGETTLVGPSDFRPNADGDHTWFNVMFPATGVWTITLYKTADNTSLATLAVTVI